MRIFPVITDGSTVRDILAHSSEPTAPPCIAPARGQPLWEVVSAEHAPPTRSRAPAHPGLRVRAVRRLVATSVAARLRAPAQRCGDRRAEQPIPPKIHV